jgi:hypothetical protein
VGEGDAPARVKNYQVYLLADLARLACYVGKCWGGQGAKLRVWKEIGISQNFEAIREDATYDELSSFTTEHRKQVLRRWGPFSGIPTRDPLPTFGRLLPMAAFPMAAEARTGLRLLWPSLIDLGTLHGKSPEATC